MPADLSDGAETQDTCINLNKNSIASLTLEMPPAPEFPSTPLPPLRSALWSSLNLLNNFQHLRLPTLIRYLILHTNMRKKKSEMPAPVANLMWSKLSVLVALYLVVYLFLVYYTEMSGRCFSSSRAL